MSGARGQPSKGMPSKIFELSSLKCRVHPNVILTMLDAHNRRMEKRFALGALLGTLSLESSIVEICDCIPLEYTVSEKEESVAVKVKDYEESVTLRQRINAQLVVVGFAYSTANVNEVASKLNIWMLKEKSSSKFAPTVNFPEPIHLSIDTSLASRRLNIKATARGPIHAVFREVPMEVTVGPQERTAVANIFKSGFTNEELGIESLESPEKSNLGPPTFSTSSLQKLLQLTTKAENYVNRVISGEEPANPTIGRMLTTAMRSQPSLSGGAFEKLCTTSIQDNLSVVYLTMLANLQFSVAEILSLSINSR